MKKLFSVFSALVALMFYTAAQAMPLQSFSGEPTTLEAKLGKGKWSLVVFWSHDCSVCRAETPGLSALYEKHKGKAIDVFGVSIDGERYRGRAQQFIEQTQMRFPSYLAELPFAAASYLQLSGEAFRGTPSFLLFNPSGELIGEQAGRLDPSAVERFVRNNS
ncbi:MAG: TlpA family protein disulfide reductase [Pseudomonadales bacterium]